MNNIVQGDKENSFKRFLRIPLRGYFMVRLFIARPFPLFLMTDPARIRSWQAKEQFTNSAPNIWKYRKYGLLVAMNRGLAAVYSKSSGIFSLSFSVNISSSSSSKKNFFSPKAGFNWSIQMASG